MEHIIYRLIEVGIKEPEQIMRVCALMIGATMDTQLVEEANRFMNLSTKRQTSAINRVLKDFD